MGAYGSKRLEIVQKYGEKVVARYDLHSNPEWGGASITPTALTKVDMYAFLETRHETNELSVKQSHSKFQDFVHNCVEIILYYLISACNSDFDWVYLHPPNQKYVVSKVNSNTVVNVNVNRKLLNLIRDVLLLSDENHFIKSRKSK